jgi:hypothetical protein
MGSFMSYFSCCFPIFSHADDRQKIEPTPSGSAFFRLPLDIIERILGQVPPQTVRSFGRTCYQINVLVGRSLGEIARTEFPILFPQKTFDLLSTIEEFRASLSQQTINRALTYNKWECKIDFKGYFEGRDALPYDAKLTRIFYSHIGTFREVARRRQLQKGCYTYTMMDYLDRECEIYLGSIKAYFSYLRRYSPRVHVGLQDIVEETTRRFFENKYWIVALCRVKRRGEDDYGSFSSGGDE